MKKNNFITSSIAYVFAAFLLKGLSFLTIPIFTRLMGTSDYGIVSNFTTWGQVLAIFLCLQLSSSMLTAKNSFAENRFENYSKSIIIGCILSSFLFSCFIILLIKPINKLTELDYIYILMLIVFAFGNCMINMFSNYCIATARVGFKVAFSIISSILVTGLGLLFVFLFSDKSFGRIIGYIVPYSIVSCFLMIYFLLKPKDDFSTIRKDLKYACFYSVPLIPHLLANLINGSADKIFIIKYLGESENGIYSLAYSIGVIALTFADACGGAWSPWYFEKTKEKNDKLISNYFIFYSITIAMCFFGIIMLSPEMMKIMGSEEYWSGTDCIPYVALGVFFLFMYRFPLCYEQLLANTKYVAPATITTALINIFLDIFLIPKLGIIGAAIATLISYIVLWILHELVARFLIKGYNLKIKNYIIPVLIVCIAFVVVSIIRIDNTLRYILVGIACLLYLLALICVILRRKKCK